MKSIQCYLQENFPSFKSYDTSEMKIVSIKPATQKYLFSGSGSLIKTFDPKYNSKLASYGNVYEFGLPVVFATNEPSNAFCYKPTEKYKKTRKEHGKSVYHRLTHKNIKILLGANLHGFIHVIPGDDFYEVVRDDFEVGKWTRSTEWISINKIKPIDVIPITKPYDWIMIPEYEFIGYKYVGQMTAKKYLSIATDDTTKNAIQNIINKPFTPYINPKLKKYMK
jgi:hypothetical protein